MLSKSASSVIEGKNHKALILGQSEKVDKSFLLFNFITENTRIHIWLYGLILIYFIFQNLGVALWPLSSGLYDYNQFYGKVIKYVGYIAFWCDLSAANDNPLIMTIVFIGITIIEVVFCIFVFFYCYSRATFPLPLLYIMRFLLELLPLIIAIPMAVLSGHCIAHIFSGTALIYVCLILGAIFTIIQILIFFKMHSMIALSTFMTRGVFNTFVPEAMKSYMLYGIMIVYVQFIATKVDLYIRIVLHVLQVAWAVFLIIRFLPYLPFQDNITNSAFTSLFVSHILTSLFVVIQRFANFRGQVTFLIWIISFIASMFGFFAYFNYYEKKIEKHLKPEAAEGQDIVDYYTQLGLLKNERKMHLYIRIGLKHGSGLFINWSLIKNAIPAYPLSVRIRFLVIQILCFFPSETRLLNSIFNTALNMRGLRMEHRFLIFQVYRIKLLRQSSASMGVTEALLEMKQITKDCYSIVTNFWTNVPRDPTVLAMISNQLNLATSKWQNAVQEHPNLQSFCEEYSKFCIECSTQFDIAVRQKNKVNLIEAGHNFMVDHCYRSMIRVHPFYVKKGLMDVRGNFMHPNGAATTKGGGSRSSSKQSSSSSSSAMVDENDIENEEEELIASQILTQPKTRLAFQHAIEGKDSKSDKFAKTFAIIATILLIGLSVGVFFWLINYFNPVVSSLSEQMKINEFNFFQSAGRFLTYFFFSYNAEGITPPPRNYSVRFTDDHNLIFFSDGADATDALGFGVLPTLRFLSTANYLYDARKYISEFQELIAKDSFNGVNLWETIPPFIEPLVQLNFCGERLPTESSSGGTSGTTTEAEIKYIPLNTTKNTTYNALLAYQNAVALRNVEVISNTSTLSIENLYTCSMLYSIKAIDDATAALFKSIVSYQHDYLKGTEKTLLFLAIFIPLGLYLITSVPMIVAVLNYKKDLAHLLEMMSTINEKAKQEAAQPILKDRAAFDQMDEGPKASLNDSATTDYLFIEILVTYLICPVIILIILLLARTASGEFGDLSQWMYYGGQRLPLLSMASEHLILSMIFHLEIPTFSTIDEEIDACLDLVERASQFQSILMSGSGDIRPVTGFSEKLDEIHTASHCTLDTEQAGISQNITSVQLHNSYKCVSMSVAINVAEQFIMRFKDEMDRFEGSDKPDRLGRGGTAWEEDKDEYFIQDLFFHVMHLWDSHLFTYMYEATTELEQLTIVVEQKLQRNMIICLSISIVAAILTLIGMLSFLSKADRWYQVTLGLLRRVSPAAILASHELAEYLFHKKGSTETERMTTYKRVIYDSPNPIICCAKNGTIEIVNAGVTECLGYTPEQLLGQQFDSIFCAEDKERVSQQVLLMKTGQASLTYEDHVTAISDDETQIPCRLTLIGIVESEKGTNEIDSFAIGLVDETEAKEQERIVEKAKLDSENLLYQILPRDIVIKLNQGERDISFTIPSASVMFIDIQKFSDYASTLTPEEIMTNLSLIFDSFDSLLTKYPLITKIKLIGDVYMAASGLFAPDVPPQQHAEQIVKFGLDALAELEEINIKLNTNLVVRIGVNSGGPLIGGVLGTDKPVFDIIGDTINVAARLQSTDIPGKIQIPTSTYELIQGMEFMIEQRGEVMLKGKGKTMAYLVNPSSHFFTSTAGNILSTTGAMSGQN